MLSGKACFLLLVAVVAVCYIVPVVIHEVGSTLLQRAQSRSLPSLSLLSSYDTSKESDANCTKVKQSSINATFPVLDPIDKRFVERRESIRLSCSKYRKPMTNEERNFVMSNIMIDDFHRLLFCQVPKASSSSWKNTLLFLTGKIQDIEKVTSPQRQKLFRRLSSCQPKERETILKSYKKMMVSREPLSRFISCYRDKFLHVNTALRKDLCRQVVKHVDSLEKRHTTDVLNVSLSEFTEYAHHTADWPINKQHHLNNDWRPMITMCQPCHIDYDFYADVTTIGEDSRRILKVIGAPDSHQLQWSNPSGNTSVSDQQVVESYLSQMPTSLLKKVVDIYKRDYEIFDYKPAQGTRFEKTII